MEAMFFVKLTGIVVVGSLLLAAFVFLVHTAFEDLARSTIKD